MVVVRRECNLVEEVTIVKLNFKRNISRLVPFPVGNFTLIVKAILGILWIRCLLWLRVSASWAAMLSKSFRQTLYDDLSGVMRPLA